MSTPAVPQIRILIVDDHPVLREGVAAMLEDEADFAIVGEASNGIEAIERARAARPDVILMDLQMAGMNGFEAIRAIRKENPDARILVLTTYSGDVQAVRALKAGAIGYMLKSSIRRDLLQAIRNVHQGKRHIDQAIANEIAVHVASDMLTERETAVLHLVAQGKPNKAIAWDLGLSQETVKAHLRSIFAKLDVSDRTHAVTVAIRRGIIDL